MNQTPAKLVEAILLVLKCSRLRLMVTTPRPHKFHSQIKMVRNVNIKRKHATIQMQTIFKNTTRWQDFSMNFCFQHTIWTVKSAIFGSKKSLKTHSLVAGLILQIWHFWQFRLYAICPSFYNQPETFFLLYWCKQLR